ncbi:polymerase [Flavobacterium sp. L1I52]|uniref:Polymerase n=1 Tax=Flavobacterium pokkalii TaxID=1940408 RepID=A0ABR7UTC7_9FLAO|nr:DUF4240 domain-containing protein [Flavobacterium pokkalii]MBD0725225.1 polymerase [Flavobacterium pokkalii]
MKTKYLYLSFFLMLSFIQYSQNSIVKRDEQEVYVDSVELTVDTVRVARIDLDSIHFKATNEMLDENIYWEIIQKSLKETSNQEDQEIYLTTELEKLSPKEMIGFRLRTDKLLFDSYTSNLWCANYIISNGGADDGFDYFRCWLISRGKEAYYKTLENPDYLVNLVDNEPKTYDFEGFWYVGNNAFKEVTDKEAEAYIDYENFKTTDENYPILDFNWNVDEPQTMEKVCPVLFKKFMKK